MPQFPGEFFIPDNEVILPEEFDYRRVDVFRNKLQQVYQIWCHFLEILLLIVWMGRNFALHLQKIISL